MIPLLALPSSTPSALAAVWSLKKQTNLSRFPIRFPIRWSGGDATEADLAKIGPEGGTLLFRPFALLRLLVLFCLTASGSPAFGKQPFFTGLGDLPGGDFGSSAQAISSDGSVVVGRSDSTSGAEAFRWTFDGGMVGLGDLLGGDFDSDASDVSVDGSVVIGSSWSSSGPEAFRWTNDTGMVGLGYMTGGPTHSYATGVSANGSVIAGRSYTESGSEAFRWTSESGMVGLGDLPGGEFYSNSYGISADGSVVVGRSDSESGTEAFRWTSEEGMIGIGDLPGGYFDSRAIAVSADGTVLVGDSNSASGYEAFRWTASDGMVGLGDLAGGRFESVAMDVSADGSVVVGRGFSAVEDYEAFIWDQQHGMRNLREMLVTDYGLDVTGWTLHTATGVSGDGQTIVGWGNNPLGQGEAWIVQLPEPSTVLLLGFGGLAIWRRRHHH